MQAALVLAFLCWALPPGIAQETTDDLAVVRDAAIELGSEFGPPRVLVAFDIDNTLLAMNQELGSDQWFQWQSEMQRSDPDSPLLVARDLPGLLEIQGLLFSLGKMHRPQDSAAEIIRDLQSRGFLVIAITSRGHGFRVATARELAHNGYDLSSSRLSVRDESDATYLPYEPQSPQAAGIPRQLATRWRFAKPRPVWYIDGVFMVAGQHKGAMLLTLLARSDQRVAAIVFADDHQRHVDRVKQALGDGPIKLRAFRYSREDARVKRFQAADKAKVTAAWRKLRRTLDEIFGEPVAEAPQRTP